MPTTAILAPSTGPGTSTAVTVTSTTPATVTLFTASGPLDNQVSATVEKQNSTGGWNPLATQLQVAATVRGAPGNPIVLTAPGVYRVQVPTTRQSVGVDLDQ